jgi:hypothetical protein
MPNRHVVPGPNGWNVKIPGQATPEGTYPTQGEAEWAAKETVRQQGGGEVHIHQRDGTIRDSDRVAPGNDPRRSHDTKH